MAMRRATITIPDDLEEEIDAYMEEREAPPSLTTLVQAALRHYLLQAKLEAREYSPPVQPFQIAPAETGSGLSDVSINHDKYFAEGVAEDRD